MSKLAIAFVVRDCSIKDVCYLLDTVFNLAKAIKFHP